MVFSSTTFLFIFLPITLLVYYVIKDKFRNYWLLITSLVFFAWAQPKYLWIIILNIIINYTGAMLIDKFSKHKKLILVIDIILNLAILFYFKYFNFAFNSINSLFKTTFDIGKIILPIGISFFTFQGLSYVIDVYRKDVKVQKNILKLALYIALFPQLVAGPIVRYTDIANEIDRRVTNLDGFTSGIERFIIGLSKKAIIANTMALMVDSVWNSGVSNHSAVIAWATSIAYTLQIYFDFSGYSDMAIGLGRMFGFHFNENFNLPYVSGSISEFWRRWHISLSSWFKDYVYIPLGGNRKRVYLNLFIVFLLTGIWHGAAWNFLLWGLWNALFILIERFFRVKNAKKNLKPKPNIFKTVISKIYALLAINFGWVLFRAPHSSDAIQFTKCMFGKASGIITDNNLFWYMDRWTLLIFIIGIIFSTPIPSKIAKYLKLKLNDKVFTVLKYGSLIVLMAFAVTRVVSGTYNPFIYFQF